MLSGFDPELGLRIKLRLVRVKQRKGGLRIYEYVIRIINQIFTRQDEKGGVVFFSWGGGSHKQD